MSDETFDSPEANAERRRFLLRALSGASAVATGTGLQMLAHATGLPVIQSFTVVDVSSGADMSNFISSGTVSVPTDKGINVRANALDVASVIFTDSAGAIQTENNAPYAFKGDDGKGHYRTWRPANGIYIIRATPYTGKNGTGTAGATAVLTLTVTNGAAPAPTPAPSPAPAPAPAPAPVAGKARMILLADIGNEPDEVQQIIHLLLCSNEIQIEGLVAVTGEYLRTINATHPAKFTPLIDAYEKDYPNLQLHAAGWPVPTYLRSIVSMGQPTYGVAGIGPGKSSAGSNLIIAAVTKADPRPVYIVVNAGSNTLAQALQDYRASHSIAETDAFVAKLRVYENGAQDDAGAWINHEFPSIFWIRSKDQTYAYGGPGNTNLGPYVWQPYNNSPQGQDAWADENVRINHGALGALYPHRLLGSTMYYAEGGGTIPWIGLITASLNDTTDKSQLSWGGWSGRFTSQKVTGIFSYHTDVAAAEQAYAPFSVHAEVNDKWTNPASGTVYTGHAAAVWRWREAMWNDFKVRNDWCVMPYSKANHRPVAVLNGNNSKEIIRLQAQTNQTLNLSAAGSSDPDQGAVRYAWWHYQEAGNNPYGKSIVINNPTAQSINFTVPIDAAGKEIHLILEVWDSHPTAPLVDYRRAVITVFA